MRLRPRFSLRTLFVLVAIAGVFCAYHINWIRQRHELRQTCRTRFASFNQLKAERGVADALNTYIDNPQRPSPRNLLWLFGEKQVTDFGLPIYIFDDDDQTTEKSELQLARSLFPEAQLLVACYLWKLPKSK
jgi:hypothetical protein